MSTIFKSKVRKIGSSYGVLIPKEVMVDNYLSKDEEVSLSILNKSTSKVTRLFGSAKIASPFKRDHIGSGMI